MKGYYSIEGNIGSGKTTFINVLSKATVNNRLFPNLNNTRVVEEPVKQWQDMNGSNILDSFYKEPNRYAFTFQMTTFVTRTRELQKALSYEDSFVIAERSVLTDKNVFSKNCYESGLMNDMEYSVYTEMFGYLNSQTNLRPNGIIYIKTPPETCMSRINERNRSEEVSIPLDYLQSLHRCHEDWLLNQKKIPVLVLDGSLDFKNDENVKNEFLMKINDFISENDS